MALTSALWAVILFKYRYSEISSCFHLVQRTSLSHSFRVCLLPIDSQFSFIGECLHFLFIPKGSICQIWDFELTVIFFQHFKMLCHFLLALMVSGRKSENLFSLLARTIFLTPFKAFFLSLVFRRFTMMYLGVDFLDFILFGVYSLELAFLCLLPNLSFLSLFLQLLAQSCIFLSLSATLFL